MKVVEKSCLVLMSFKVLLTLIQSASLGSFFSISLNCVSNVFQAQFFQVRSFHYNHLSSFVTPCDSDVFLVTQFFHCRLFCEREVRFYVNITSLNDPLDILLYILELFFNHWFVTGWLFPVAVERAR